MHPQFSGLKRVHFNIPLDNILGDQIVPSILDDILPRLSGLGCRRILYVDPYEVKFHHLCSDCAI
jgi:hypothetical protein